MNFKGNHLVVTNNFIRYVIESVLEQNKIVVRLKEC